MNMNGRTVTLERRSFLNAAVAGVVGMALGARMSDGTDSISRHVSAEPSHGAATPGPAGSTVLLAYFSRAGENYFYGDRIDLDVGNTEVMANMIRQLIGCDIYRIEPVDPYSDDYDETVGRNVQEQQADARPAIANPLDSIERYDTVLLGSPIWNVRPPMIMATFAESVNFTGKTIIPFTTHAMSGLGTTERDYADWCPGATFAEGLAVQGEEVREAGDAIESWLRRIGLLGEQ